MNTVTHKNKSRLLYTLKLLTETTDASNPVSIVKIINYLKSLGISAHRKTVAADMEMLLEFGIDVVTIKSTQNRYFIGSRDFELPEVKLLVDAVEASKFITVRKRKVLIRKLSTLVSINQAQELKRY